MVISPVTIGLAGAPSESPTPAQASDGCGCGGCGCGGGGGGPVTESGQLTESGPAADSTSATAAYAVEGMTCGHCVGAVKQELSAVAGVTDVEVELVVGGRSTVTVRSAAPLDVVDVRAALDEAGYTLVGQD